MKCSHIQPNLIFARASVSPTLKLATVVKIKYIFLVKEPSCRKLPGIPDPWRWNRGTSGCLVAKMEGPAGFTLPASGHLSNRWAILTSILFCSTPWHIWGKRATKWTFHTNTTQDIKTKWLHCNLRQRDTQTTELEIPRRESPHTGKCHPVRFLWFNACFCIIKHLIRIVF